MKSILISGATAEELQTNVEAFLEEAREAQEAHEFDAIEIISVQQYNKQLVTPNHLSPQNPKVEFVFQLLIIYK